MTNNNTKKSKIKKSRKTYCLMYKTNVGKENADLKKERKKAKYRLIKNMVK